MQKIKTGKESVSKWVRATITLLSYFHRFLWKTWISLDSITDITSSMHDNFLMYGQLKQQGLFHVTQTHIAIPMQMSCQMSRQYISQHTVWIFRKIKLINGLHDDRQIASDRKQRAGRSCFYSNFYHFWSNIMLHNFRRMMKVVVKNKINK